MSYTVSDHINRIKSEGDNTVVYRYEGHGDSVLKPIDEFLREFGDRKVGLNGEIYYADGTVNRNNFIKRTKNFAR